MVLADAGRLVVMGLLLGVPLALAGGSSLQGLLFGVGPQDVTTVVGACLALTATATLAAYVPSRRAAAVDPIIALRYE
jgi:ABC-type antimicrobial peptide transport system permease subunit